MLATLRSKLFNSSVFALTESGKLTASKGVEVATRSNGPEDTAEYWLNLRSLNSAAGVSVNHNNAQSLSAVYSCVKIMADTMSSLSWDVIATDRQGNREKLPNHRVAKLLRAPHPLYSGNTWFETMQAWATLRGNGIALIVRDGKGYPTALRHFPVSQVTIKYDQAEEILIYTFHDLRTGKFFVADSYDVIHIRALVWDGTDGWGKSPLEAHRDTIGLGIAGQQYMAGMMRNGAHIPGILTTDAKLEKEAADRMSKSWRARYGGSGNSGSTPVLEQGLKYQPLNLSPADAEWMATQKFTVEEISRIFRVPMHMMSALERSTNNNIEQQALEFVTNTVRPWVKRWESELSKLFSDQEQGRVSFRFDLNSLLRGDVAARASLYETYMKWGIMSVDEIRRLEGQNPIETGEGTTHLYPANMVPFEKLGQPGNGSNGLPAAPANELPEPEPVLETEQENGE